MKWICREVPPPQLQAWAGAADGPPHQSDSELKVSVYNQKSHIVSEYNADIKVEKDIPCRPLT